MPQLKIIYFNSFDKWRTPAKTFATLLKLRVKELSKSRISLHQHTLHVPTRSEIHLTRWHLTNSRILLTYLLLFLSMRRCLLFSSLANYVFLYLLLRNFAHITAIRTRNDKRLDTVVISRSYTLQANARSHRIELVKKKKKKKKRKKEKSGRKVLTCIHRPRVSFVQFLYMQSLFIPCLSREIDLIWDISRDLELTLVWRLNNDELYDKSNKTKRQRYRSKRK